MIDFNSGWICHHLGESGSSVPVSIPHDAMLAEPRQELSAGGINTGWFEGRDYRYAKKKEVGIQFFNDIAGLLGDEFMKRGATLHGCDVRIRDAFANMDIAGYNYGIYRYEHDL